MITYVITGHVVVSQHQSTPVRYADGQNSQGLYDNSHSNYHISGTGQDDDCEQVDSEVVNATGLFPSPNTYAVRKGKQM